MKNKNKIKVFLVLTFLLISAIFVFAGKPIKVNFLEEINLLKERVTTLESQVSNLETNLSALQILVDSYHSTVCVPEQEICDDVDNDCDDLIDEDFSNLGGFCYAGAGACSSVGFFICSDSDPSTTECSAVPGVPDAEQCNGIDDDCDGEVDEEVNADCELTVGVCSGSIAVCTFGQIQACTAADYGPDFELEEVTCDGQDNDCDGETDEGCSIDLDDDGYASDVDCDDSNPNVNPGAIEIIDNGLDDDCDSMELCYFDGDMDGYRGTGIETTLSTDLDCNDGYEATVSTPIGDCDDGDSLVYPGADDIPGDGVDQDCNGFDSTICYIDDDRDGFGNLDGSTTLANDGTCDTSQGESLVASDCDDNDVNIFPGNVEICDSKDNDCDGETDEGC